MEPTSDDALLKAEPRDYFGPGMGKKSNSTSQLSATGEFLLFTVNEFVADAKRLLCSQRETSKDKYHFDLSYTLLF